MRAMSKVAAIAKLTAAEGKEQALTDLLRSLVGSVETEEGTLLYVLNVDSADPRTFWFYELYASSEAAQAHSGGDALKQAGRAMMSEGLLAGAPEIYRLAPLTAKGTDI